jgi:hypothetical protein
VHAYTGKTFRHKMNWFVAGLTRIESGTNAVADGATAGTAMCFLLV